MRTHILLVYGLLFAFWSASAQTGEGRSGDRGEFERRSAVSDESCDSRWSISAEHSRPPSAATGGLSEDPRLDSRHCTAGDIVQIQTPQTVDKKEQWTVSIKQLEHKVPKEAWKEYKKAQSSIAKRDYQKAREHLDVAVSVDPEFADAFNDLGFIHAIANESEQAIEQFQKALDLVPDHARATSNMAISLFKLQRYRDAARVARRALIVNSGLPRMHFVLGVAIADEHGNLDEALMHLNRAATDVPNARLVASQILEQTGHHDDAVKEVEQYLRVADGQENRARAQAWLAQIQK
jgi:tetratricopeptide (TPR) repeat protein